MNDRELLELAAKAAGYSKCLFCELSGGQPALYVDDGVVGLWAPLTDDGDALRLAVKLNLWLHAEEYGASARCAGGAWLGCEAHLHGGIEAATRRAIVRAAAAIGKEM